MCRSPHQVCGRCRWEATLNTLYDLQGWVVQTLYTASALSPPPTWPRPTIARSSVSISLKFGDHKITYCFKDYRRYLPSNDSMKNEFHYVLESLILSSQRNLEWDKKYYFKLFDCIYFKLTNSNPWVRITAILFYSIFVNKFTFFFFQILHHK